MRVFLPPTKGILKFLSNTLSSRLNILAINIDTIAIIIMESLGALSTFVALLFLRQRRRICNKQKAFVDALNLQAVGGRGDGKCFSSEWVMDNIVHKPRRLLNATLLLATILGFLFAILFYGVFPLVFANLAGFGYTVVVAMLGIAILVWTDAFEAYGYVNSIYKVATEQLDIEDQSYIELARKAVEKAFLRFISLGVAFALLGPFIPQIFTSVVYAFTMYATIYFGTSEASFQALTFLGWILTILVLPVLMLILPLFLGRILIHRGKLLSRRIYKRKVEQ